MTRTDVESVYRLSFMQQGLMVHSLADRDAAFYVDQAVYTLHGALDTAAFRGAWRDATARHEVLRTTFHHEDLDELVQVVHRSVTPPVAYLDWRAVAPEEQAGRLEVLLRADRRQGFDLEAPPLFRITLVRLTDDRHAFVFRYHHLLLDAWSALRLLDEVFASYDALARGELSTVERARPYRDYVAWLHRQDLTAAEAYWRQALRGFAEPTRLPLRAAVSAPAEDLRENPEQTLSLGTELTTALRGLAQRHGLTLNTVLQGAWALVLSRYCGRDDVVFGTTIAVRPPDLPGAQEIVGLLINTLPVRVALPPAARLVACWQALQQQEGERRRYEYSPLVAVQGWSEVPPDTPLFDTIMTFLNVPGIAAIAERDGALRVRDGQYRYRTNYPVSVMVVPGADLTVYCGYDRDRVDDAAVGRLLGHLRTVLEAVVANPDLAVWEVPLLTAAEAYPLVVRWNDTAASYPRTARAADLVAGEPDAVAIVYGRQRLTYRELDERTNRLAHHLRGLGVGPDVRVGLCVDRGLDLVVGVLGILKAGGAYLPLDPDYPAERLAHMLADARVPVLLTQRHLRDRLPRGQERRVLLDAHAPAIARQPADPVDSGVTPGNLAYVIYTSGSTGTPKGAMLAHGGLANLAEAQRRVFDLGPGDQILQWASASFDASVFEIVMAWYAGATLHLADREAVMPGPGLRALLAERGITCLTIPPSALAALAGPEAGELPRLRTLVLAGEALPAALVRQWAAGRRVFNAYGPTETTVWATVHACAAGPDAPPIGAPIANTRVYVLDALQRPVPIGVPGELYLAGDGLARGYLNRPGLTAERFVPDPFGPPGGRLYRTGDLVAWRADGELEFVGRVDRQVKVRGFRIEIGEIESVLGRHPAIGEVAVVRDEPDTLVAYCVPRAAASDAQLREFLRARLPEYMVPASIVRVERLPLTPNGKLDLAALPALAAGGPPADGFVPPATPTEIAVAEIWAHLLGAQRVGVHDDFFDLGGNSIKATQLISRIRRAWGVELTLRAMLEARTVERCATAVENAVLAQIEAMPEDDAERLAAGLVTADPPKE